MRMRAGEEYRSVDFERLLPRVVEPKMIDDGAENFSMSVHREN